LELLPVRLWVWNPFPFGLLELPPFFCFLPLALALPQIGPISLFFFHNILRVLDLNQSLLRSLRLPDQSRPLISCPLRSNSPSSHMQSEESFPTARSHPSILSSSTRQRMPRERSPGTHHFFPPRVLSLHLRTPSSLCKAAPSKKEHVLQASFFLPP